MILLGGLRCRSDEPDLIGAKVLILKENKLIKNRVSVLLKVWRREVQAEIELVRGWVLSNTDGGGT